MKLILSNRLLPTLLSIQKVIYHSIQAFPQQLNLKTNILQKRMKSSLSQRLLMHQKIIKTIYNCKYHLHPEMMPFIWALCTWDHQRVSLLGWCSILAQNILPSPLHSVMTKLPGTSSSRSTIHSQALSFRETN